jgi:hypothetical protein
MNTTNQMEKAKRATAKFAKFIFPFYCFYKKVKEAYEEINQFTWYFAIFFLIVLVALAYDEWNKKAEDDELGKLRRERDINKKYAKIGKLFVEGKLPPSNLLKDFKIEEQKGTHLTIYAVINGKSNLIKGSCIYYNELIANQARANVWDGKQYIQNHDAYESFDSELYETNLYKTIKEAEKFIEKGGNSELRRAERMGDDETSERKKYLITKFRSKLNKYGFSVKKKTRSKTPKRK